MLDVLEVGVFEVGGIFEAESEKRGTTLRKEGSKGWREEKD
jgi:hypothetical protein